MLISCRIHFAESLQADDNKWIQCFSNVKPELPRNMADVSRVLLSDVHGKLPMTKELYKQLTGSRRILQKYLVQADGSQIPTLVSTALQSIRGNSLFEMDTTLFIGPLLIVFFSIFRTYSPHKLGYTLAFNCNEKTGDSFSDVTVDRSRPGTLCMASGRTLFVGEDKLKGLLPTIYYGGLEFILGYIVAGSEFQWIFVGKHNSSDLIQIRPILDLIVIEQRCKFILSLGYAYHLLCSMVDVVPEVQSDCALFHRDVTCKWK